MLGCTFPPRAEHNDNQQGVLFELQLSKRAGTAMKKTIADLTHKVWTLQTSTGSLQMSAHDPSNIHDSSASKKHAAAPDIPVNDEAGVTPSTLR